MKKETNRCKSCYREVNSSNSLIKLKDGNWYCTYCICLHKELLGLLKPNGYWYNSLKDYVRFNLDDKIT